MTDSASATIPDRPAASSLPRWCAVGGMLLTGTICVANSWHIWSLTAVASDVWRLKVIASDSGIFAGLAVAFALAAFGPPRVRRVGWFLVVALFVSYIVWAAVGLGSLITAALPPLGVPEPPQDPAHPPLSDTERERIIAFLYRTHADPLCTFADRLLRHRGRHLRAVTAEDLVHDAFALLLVDGRDALLQQGGDAVRNYLTGAIKNMVTDQGRTTQRRAALTELRYDPQGVDATLAPDVEYTNAELEVLVAEVLARAPAREAAAYQAVRVEGLSYLEAAAKLGVTTDTIGTLLSRLAVRFRRALRDWPVPPPRQRPRRRPSTPSSSLSTGLEEQPNV